MVGKIKPSFEEYGFVCFNCSEQSPVASNEKESYDFANKAGYVLGHVNGQAHYACGSCSPLLFQTMPVRSI